MPNNTSNPFGAPSLGKTKVEDFHDELQLGKGIFRKEITISILLFAIAIIAALATLGWVFYLQVSGRFIEWEPFRLPIIFIPLTLFLGAGAMLMAYREREHYPLFVNRDHVSAWFVSESGELLEERVLGSRQEISWNDIKAFRLIDKKQLCFQIKDDRKIATDCSKLTERERVKLNEAVRHYCGMEPSDELSFNHPKVTKEEVEAAIRSEKS